MKLCFFISNHNDYNEVKTSESPTYNFKYDWNRRLASDLIYYENFD